MTHDDLLNNTQKTKDRATRTQLKTNRGLSHVLRNGKQFLLHTWQPLCYSC